MDKRITNNWLNTDWTLLQICGGRNAMTDRCYAIIRIGAHELKLEGGAVTLTHWRREQTTRRQVWPVVKKEAL